VSVISDVVWFELYTSELTCLELFYFPPMFCKAYLVFFKLTRVRFTRVPVPPWLTTTIS